MNAPRSPEGEMADIMDLDREIEALRLGTGRANDRSLSLLVQLRDDVDQRAATLLGRHDDEPDEWLEPAGAARAPRRRRRNHRLAVLPVAGALVLASTGAAAALSASPHAPLYPLHRLIFGTTSNTSASQVSRDLAEAQILLNRAAAQPYAARAGDLAQVRTLLADAQRLLPDAGSSRGQLSIEIAAARARLAQLESPPVAATTPSPAPLPSQPTDEGPSAPGASGGESEPSAAASLGAETEAPENVPPLGQAPVSEAPEPGPSAAPTGLGGWTNDQPTGSESEPAETAQAETHTAGSSSTVDN